MKIIPISISLIFTFLLILAPKSESAEPFALVELYTSEGCSSCPVADQLLTQLTHLAKDQNKAIYTLGFHVDYWNYLNWVDEYSKPEYSNRQRTYASKIKGSSVYTPQMIINGTYQVGGYRGDLVKEYIEESLAQIDGVALDAQLSIKNNFLIISSHFDKSAKNLLLNTALVETNISNNIKSGENAGKKLIHSNVVREFSSTPLVDNNLETTMSLPTDLNQENASVILYLQDKNTYKVLGAKQLPLRP